MLDFPRWKIVLVIVTCLAGIFFALPSYFGIKDRANIPAYLPKQTMSLGLDLQGGSYLLLEVDFSTYIKDQVARLRDDVRATLRKHDGEEERIGYQGGISVVNESVSLSLRDPATADKARARIKKDRPDLMVEVTPQGLLTVGFTEERVKEMKKNLLDQSIEIVRRRVDETGTREPSLQRQGEMRILLQVPGLQDPSQIKRLLGKTAKLTFHLLDPNTPYVTGEATAIPQDAKRMDGETNERGETFAYVVKREVILSGDALVDAHATHQDGIPVVSFRFDNLGAKVFGEVTKANTGRPFAIVLDNKVISAPVIREPILGGAGIISGSFTTQSANELAMLLRAGALPAPLNIVEERMVGPSLGTDSVESGKKAIIVGFILVVAVMCISYARFGLYSSVGLLVNNILVFAVLSLLEATLTLPGIAGIVLSMGMAVDANVLIYERIREELRSGRSLLMAVDMGFRQAFATIMDSNITTLIAAVLLYILGSGPIKGFAVTLSVGILTSMFSAILVTRLLIVLWLKRTRPKTINI
ncbi:MAG: secD [Rickettsiales bacterium]|jgi:protein-export membrane protein SecD|nr:secD [Rickettsiales bacterium]